MCHAWWGKGRACKMCPGLHVCWYQNIPVEAPHRWFPNDFCGSTQKFSRSLGHVNLSSHDMEGLNKHFCRSLKMIAQKTSSLKRSLDYKLYFLALSLTANHQTIVSPVPSKENGWVTFNVLHLHILSAVHNSFLRIFGAVKALPMFYIKIPLRFFNKS